MSEKERVAKAVAGVRSLRDRLAKEIVEFGVVSKLTEEFCQAVRAELKKHRLRLKMEQKELAERMDISQSAVSKIETGDGDMGLKNVSRYATALGLKPVILFVPNAQELFEKAAETAEGLLVQSAETVTYGTNMVDWHIDVENATVISGEASRNLRSVMVMAENLQVNMLQEVSESIGMRTKKDLSNLLAAVIAEKATKKEEIGEGA